MSEKLDFKKSLDSYKAKHGEFRILDVPPMNYLMCDGHGDPNSSPMYAETLSALYPVAYKLKFASKQELDRDYAVPPLEGLWWAEDMTSFTTDRDKSKWDWTMMLFVPDWISQEHFEAAVKKVGAKTPPSRLSDVRLESLSEGRCVQTLHIGSFDNEAPLLARMHEEFIRGNGFKMNGKHHEIYFSDFRKVAQEQLRTMLRQPISLATT
ncbi:MAG: GyrI-like domain-containing protein [Cryobacterium sp.]|nr:GyrI-like domain-containing protein [Cryobacterium sp.]